jgi:hypothetical protein
MITQLEEVGSNMEWASVTRVKRKDALTKVIDLVFGPMTQGLVQIRGMW